MYDIAMELANRKGRPLTCDRGAVSQKAGRIWSHYLDHPDIYEAEQLDDKEIPFLTPNDLSDDCEQDSTYAYLGD